MPRVLLLLMPLASHTSPSHLQPQVTGKSFNPPLEAPDAVKKINRGKTALYILVRRGAGDRGCCCLLLLCTACGGMRVLGAVCVDHIELTAHHACRRVHHPHLPPTLPLPQVRGSKFVKYQECKIQESPDEVPQGSTPRTLMVHLRGSLTRSLKAGDSVTLSGIFLPEPYTGQVRGVVTSGIGQLASACSCTCLLWLL